MKWPSDELAPPCEYVTKPKPWLLNAVAVCAVFYAFVYAIVGILLS